MNKKRVEKLIQPAMDALNDPNCKIQNRDSAGNFNGEIASGFRGQISSFGAAVTMGSFKAAAAFFAKDKDKSQADVNRDELLRVMYRISSFGGTWKDAKDIAHEIFDLDDSAERLWKEEFINASIALKLALNAFKLI